MQTPDITDDLRKEITGLRARLEECEASLRAIRSGKPDAITVETQDGPRGFTLEGADLPYREMVETMSEGAVTATPDGIILYCNQRFAEMVRTDLRSMIGASLLACFGGDDGDRIAAALRAGEPALTRHFATLAALDGTRVPVSVTMRGRQDTSLRSVAIVLGDLTEIAASQEELRAAKEQAEQTEAMLRDALDSTSEGFVIFDRDDRLVMCNDAYRAYYRSAADILVPGTRFIDIMRAIGEAAVFVASAGREDEWLRERIRQHQECAEGVELRLRNGRWLLANDRRMRNGGIASLRVDITALKQAEAHLDLAQAIAGIGSWELDVETGHYVWSKQLFRIRGLSPESFTPTIDSVVPYLHPDDYLAARNWIARLMAGRETGAQDSRIVRPDGEVRVVRIEGRAIVDPDGVIRRLSGTMQDVTERRLIERQLAQAQKMEAIGMLTGGMAHDFNNGLGVIIGNLELLARRVKTDPESAELCAEARDGALRCGDLIRRLLAFARRQPLQPVQTDVNALVSEAARLLARSLGTHIILKLDLNAALWPALADPAQLEAALLNLATNASDAMPRGGTLRIATSNIELDAPYIVLHPEANPGAHVLLEVSDTGIGIDPEILGRIFDPFFTTKGHGQRSGLGLSMVFGFAKQSGGHVAVHSELGRGSTFRVYLPRAGTNDARSPAPDDRSEADGGDETILVVEDNTALRLVATQQLEELGYRVLQAEDAATALQVLASEDRIDLLFTDVVMPGAMDGFDLAHKAIAMRAGLRVLLTSGFPAGRTLDQGWAESGFRLLSKPYRCDDLARAVREALDRPVDLPKGHKGQAGERGDPADWYGRAIGGATW